jgi:glycosyltransferase involved in cell wall biosynthesis
VDDRPRPALLLFIETGGPGGAERVVLHLAGAFRERGHAVSTATLREGWLTENLAAAGIDHTLVRSESRLDLTLPLRLARLAKRKGAALIHSHLLDSNLYAALAAKAGGIAHLATEHGDVHHIARKRLAGAKLRVLALLGTRFTAVSDFTAGRLAELGIGAESIDAVPNPIPAPEPAGAGERAVARASLGVDVESEGHWLWIHVANIRPVKDQETLVRGFARAREHARRPQTLAIVGDGPARPGLEALAGSLGLGDSVRFLGFRDDVPRWLAAADGFVLSSRSEAMPMSLLEGMAAGLYPVATDVGGVREVIRSGEGRLVRPGDPEALGRALAAAADDAGASREIAAAGAGRVRREYSVESIAARYEAIYRELLG